MRTLLRRYQAGLPDELRVHDLESELAELAQRYPWPCAALFLARSGDADAGCVVANPLDSSTLEVRRLYVEPAFRGSGTARALMEALTAFARERSHRRLVLDTEREILRPAYELYVKLGFTQCAPYAETTYANPTYMELALV